jgi:hypothetical protein
MLFFIILHTHRHGVSIYTLKADHEPSQQEVIDRLGIDFEEHKEETIDIEEHDLDTVPVL